MTDWLSDAKALMRGDDGAYGLPPSADAGPTPFTDKQRFDWIEANRACVGHYKETNLWYSRAGRSFKTAREAIDAAMRPSCSAK